MEMQETSKKLAEEFNPLAQKFVDEKMPANALLIAFAADFDIRAETAEEKSALTVALFNAATGRIKKSVDSGGYSSIIGEVTQLLQALDEQKVKEFLPETASNTLAELAVKAVARIGKISEEGYNSYNDQRNEQKVKNLSDMAKVALDYARKFGAASPKKPDAILSAKHLAA